MREGEGRVGALFNVFYGGHRLRGVPARSVGKRCLMDVWSFCNVLLQWTLGSKPRVRYSRNFPQGLPHVIFHKVS